MGAPIELADILRNAGSAFRASRAGHLSLAELKVMSAIVACRTAALGAMSRAATRVGTTLASATTYAAPRLSKTTDIRTLMATTDSPM